MRNCLSVGVEQRIRLTAKIAPISQRDRRTRKFLHKLNRDKPIPKTNTKKLGLPLGTGSPGRRVSDASVVFTPARGVIHPSFPLRGRWERTFRIGKQAPSPSLAILSARKLIRAHASTIAITAPSPRGRSFSANHSKTFT